jgi:RHH-type rel operon transcriptional repressor/antitoxin RelB
MLAVRLPASIEKRLERLAKRTGRTKTFYAREAILQHLDDLEEVYLAERVLDRIRSGEEGTIPLEKVMKRHGMEVRFTPELEAKLNRIAAESGRVPDEYVRELVEHYLDHDAWFRQEVQKGLDQLDRGEFVSHDEVVASIERMFRS